MTDLFLFDLSPDPDLILYEQAPFIPVGGGFQMTPSRCRRLMFLGWGVGSGPPQFSGVLTDRSAP